MGIFSFLWPNTSPSVHTSEGLSSQFRAEDYDRAALDELYPILKSKGWWPSAREERQQAISTQRSRALAMPDPKWRKAYLHWVEYFQGDLDKDNRMDAEYAARKPEREAEERKRQHELERAQQLRAMNPPDIPTQPVDE